MPEDIEYQTLKLSARIGANGRFSPLSVGYSPRGHLIPNLHTFRTYRHGGRSGQSTKPWPAFSSVRTESVAYCQMPWRPVRCRLMLPDPADNFLPSPLEGLVEHRHVHWGSWAPWLTLQMAFILQLVMMHFA